MERIFAAWGRILAGHTPALSIEITRECPLHCPGCYAYGDNHLVREIPRHWHGLRRLSFVVSIDGLQPEHDVRRAPATYDRILKHIVGHKITVHCTVTRQQVNRAGYLDEFLRFWSPRKEVEKIWFSLYT